MKDLPVKSQRSSLIYKRPSPHGVAKPPRKSPVNLKQRDAVANVITLRREGILCEDEYRDEIRDYMLDMEQFTKSCTQSMDQQPEIKWHMRPCLVDFLVEIHFSFRLRPETLYLTLNIIDRYVSRRVVYIKHYQLVGCAALWIAAKFEDAKERVPTVQDLVQMCRNAYEESAFIQMEGHILSTISWTLGHPTAEAWLRLMCCGPCIEEPKVQHVARFLMEITLFYREFVKYCPSSIAFAALTLSRYICGKPPRVWDVATQCSEIVDLLDNRLARQVNGLSEILVKKYSYAFYSKAATCVVQYYLQGGRYQPPKEVFTPHTPTRSVSTATSSTVSTPMSTSDASDDFPLTPTTPSFLPTDSPNYFSDNKENQPTTFEPLFNKQRIETPPEQYLPHDFVAFSRPVLHSYNVSPRALVS